MMRAIVLLLFPFTFTASAQQAEHWRHSLRLGIGAVFITSGDHFGLGNYGEYAHSFNEHLAIASRIMSVTANERFGHEEFNVGILGGSIAARFTPFPGSYPGFKLDLGPTFQRLKSTKTSSGSIGGTPWTITDRVRNERETYFGALGSLSFGILQGERLGAGLRLEMITSFRDRSINSEMLHAGIFLSVGF